MAYEEVVGSMIKAKTQLSREMCHLHTLLCVDKSPFDQYNTSLLALPTNIAALYYA